MSNLTQEQKDELIKTIKWRIAGGVGRCDLCKKHSGCVSCPGDIDTNSVRDICNEILRTDFDKMVYYRKLLRSVKRWTVK